MKFKISTLLLTLLAAFPLSGCVLPQLLHARAKEAKMLATHGPGHAFVIEPAPALLTDELAAAKAQETLAREGYKPSQWHLTQVRAFPDKSIVRLTKKGRFRLYSVRLCGDRVLCHSFQGTQRDWESWPTRPKSDASVGRGKRLP